MKVLKFGGTSVGTPESIKNVLEIVQRSYLSGERPVVVLSAMGGVTNQLLELAHQASRGEDFTDGLILLEKRHVEVVKKLLPVVLQTPVMAQIKLHLRELEELLAGVKSIRELSLQCLDLVMSFGERLSNMVVAYLARSWNPSARYVDARDIIVTNQQFGNAQVDQRLTFQNIQDRLAPIIGELCFVTGFVARDGNGKTTTLGRGGSDYTASILGAALNATAIEIWTDVNGMMTADPRLVKKAFSMKELTYTEAMELSYFGAKVIYPPTMVPAFRNKIPIVIRNTFDVDFEGTRIQFSTEKNPHLIRGISSIADISLLNISGSGMVGKAGFSGKLFSVMAREQINIVLITQSSSEHSISLAVHPKDLERAQAVIQQEFELELLADKLATPEVEKNLSVLAIVGENMEKTPGMAGKLFSALARNGINVRAIAQGSSELNISVIISKSELSKALNAVHDAFFAELKKTLNIFCVGTGNIGRTLFKQILQQHGQLLENNDLDIQVIGLINTRYMLLTKDGIDLGQWQDRLEEDGQPADLGDFVQQMKDLNLPNCVLIDNTASALVPTLYEAILASNISIVTSNKIANSGPLARYRDLQSLARKHGVDFYYETNVGAGLPIIRVVKDLRMSGDRLVDVQAILSGTISYIFNNYKGTRTFRDVVREAQELGFTEPDPRDDLSGVDFMRKLLILGRDAGFPLEEDSADIQPILPDSCLKARTVAEFYGELENAEPFFAKMRKDAETNGQVLRYIGRLHEGKIRISLEKVGPDHPFYNLSGSDNIISFKTQRYHTWPLVVKGPGAGAEVTAAGVFADLVNVGA